MTSLASAILESNVYILFLCLGEEAIRQRAQELESLKDLTPVLSSEHLKSAKHLPALQRLQQVSDHKLNTSAMRRAV